MMKGMVSTLTLALGIGALFSIQTNAQSVSTHGGKGHGTVSQIPRYNVVPPPSFRHYEDVRRYNATPNPKGYFGSSFAPFPERKRARTGFKKRSTIITYADGTTGSADANSTKIKTSVVSQVSKTVPSYNSCGCRISRCMTVTVYKDTYSCGRTRIWQHIAYS